MTAVAAHALAFRHRRVQRLRRLVHRRATRDAEGIVVVEGAKLLTEALDAGAAVEGLYLAPGASDAVIARAVASGIPVHDLAPGVMERVADTVTPQPILALARQPDVALDHLQSAELVVVCVDVRDPGNLGTVLRTAEAAGAGGVICCDGTVDPYNPKCVRASAGAIFHLRLVVGGDPAAVLQQLAGWGICRMGTVARGGRSYHEVDLAGRCAIVLGNEAQGLPSALHPCLDELVSIPLAGRTESLNVGMAAAVLCFEAARQRRARSSGGSTAP